MSYVYYEMKVVPGDKEKQKTDGRYVDRWIA